MTADELRKLAEIAGLKLSSVGELLQSGSRYYHGNIKNRQIIPTYEWQPHLRIEQAMMVADTFVEWELHKTSEKRYYSFVISGDLEYYYDATEDTAALSLCRAALAAVKE